MNKGNTKLAARLRDMAETLAKEIAHRRAPRLENTRKRAQEAASQREEARRLEKIQAALIGLAAAHERDQVPEQLADVTTKKQVEHLVAGYKLSHTEQAQRDWLVELSDPQAGQVTAADQIKELERQLVGRKIDGFFPTPLPIVRAMIQYADIMPNDRILEPSAGKGNIADLVREVEPTVQLDVMEVNHTLRGILTHKGHNLIGLDCLEGHNPTYDIVIMNPPFEKLADIDHVRYCFEHYVKPGGRLVSIMGEGPFFRTDKKAMEFRDWLTEVQTAEMHIPSGAFKESGTNVATRMIVVDKPSSSDLSPDTPADQGQTEPVEETLSDEQIQQMVAAQVAGFAASFTAAMQQAYEEALSDEEGVDSLEPFTDEDGDFIPFYPDDIEEATDTPSEPSQEPSQGEPETDPLPNERRFQKSLDGFNTHDRLLKLRQTKFL